MIDRSVVNFVYLGTGETPSEIRDDTLYFDPRQKKIYLGSVAYDRANSTLVTFTEDISTGNYSADVALGDAMALIGAGQFVFGYLNTDVYVVAERTSTQLTLVCNKLSASGILTQTITWTASSITYQTSNTNSMPTATTADNGKVLLVDNGAATWSPAPDTAAVLYVPITYNSVVYSSTVKFSEIQSAIAANKVVIVKYSNNEYHLNAQLGIGPNYSYRFDYIYYGGGSYFTTDYFNIGYGVEDSLKIEHGYNEGKILPSQNGTEGQVLTMNSGNSYSWADAPLGLPECTTADNGKVLKVTNGDPAWGTDAAGATIVVTVDGTVDPETYSCSHTYAEIAALLNENANLSIEIHRVYSGGDGTYTGAGIYHMTFPAPEYRYIEILSEENKSQYGHTLHTYRIYANGNITHTSANLEYVPQGTTADFQKFLYLNEHDQIVWSDVPKELPTATTADNGKVLKISSGVPAWEIDSDAEIPAHTSADEGKMLSVDSNNALTWADVPTELPPYDGTNINEVLKVNGQGTGLEWRIDESLPSSTTADSGKVLTVDSSGNAAWATAQSGINGFKVTFTVSGGTYTADKTYSEIIAAINSGEYVYGLLDANPAGVILFLKEYNPGRVEFEYVTPGLRTSDYPSNNRFPKSPCIVTTYAVNVTNTVEVESAYQYYGTSFLYTDSSLNYRLYWDFYNIYHPIVVGEQNTPAIGRNAFNVLVVGDTNTFEYYTMSHIDDTQIIWSRITTNANNQTVIEKYTLDGTTLTNDIVVKTTEVVSSTIPTPTTADAGKFLAVDVNGNWTFASGGSSLQPAENVQF